MDDKLDQGEGEGEVARWCEEIALYAKETQNWVARSKKIIKRYKDDRSDRDSRLSKFNILWSNIQTLSPALYASVPKPNVDRRYQDDDDLGRVTAQILERSVTYFVHTELFDSVMQQCVLDRLLSGRGIAWVRYVPNFKDVTIEGNAEVKDDGVSITEDIDGGYEAEESGSGEKAPAQELTSEEVLADYIHWEDFGHTYARTWEEVRAGWKRVYMGRQELIDRFGEKVGKTIPLDYSPEKLDESKIDDRMKKATIYEIWDRSTKKVYWIHKNVKDVLDSMDDPLMIEGFFPFPKPLFSTLTNDNIIPVPDYVLYQDQASELDELTARIRMITKAIKVAGVYDKAAEGIQRLLNEGNENILIGVDQWAAFSEKGGLQGVITFLPMHDIMQVLVSLHDSRDRVKQVIYEITGISDIIRGATNPNETASAQELKGKFASLRLDAQQKDVARFSRDLVKIMTQIIAKHFSMDTIKNICGVKLMSDAEKQQVQQQAQMAQQPPDEKTQEMLSLPSWEDVEKLIRDNIALCFKIDIETDSTIKTDQEAEKKSRIEFITAAGQFIQQAAAVQNPSLQPLLMEMLLFGIRGFKVGREIEGTFKTTIDKMKKIAAQPPTPPPPDPAMISAQSQAKLADAQAQIAERQHQFDVEKAKADIGLSQQELQTKSELEMRKLQIEEQKSQAELEIKNVELEIKKADLQLKAQDSVNSHALETKKIESSDMKNRMDAKNAAHPDMAMMDGELHADGVAPMEKMMEEIMGGFQQLAAMQQQSNQQVVEALTKPKKVIRDNKGKISGVE